MAIDLRARPVAAPAQRSHRTGATPSSFTARAVPHFKQLGMMNTRITRKSKKRERLPYKRLMVQAGEPGAGHQYPRPRLQSAHLPDGKCLFFFSEKGFSTDKRDRAVTYDEFTQKMSSTLN